MIGFLPSFLPSFLCRIRAVRFVSQGLVDVAVNHELELQLGSEATKHRVGHDGLLWVGKPSSKPKVSVKRPAHAGLDEWWEQAAEELCRA